MLLVNWATYVLHHGFTISIKSVSWREARKKFVDGLWAETWPHEGGVASNRLSLRGGEFALGICTHRPSRAGSWLGVKIGVNTLEFETSGWTVCVKYGNGALSNVGSGYWDEVVTRSL
jgi:hypothetical protein